MPMTTAGLQAKVELRRAWFATHTDKSIPDAREEVERLFAAIEAEAAEQDEPSRALRSAFDALILSGRLDGVHAGCARIIGDALAANPPQTRDAEYVRRVEQMAAALHRDCELESDAIAVVDPGRALTMHLADAHLGQAHDLVRRIFPELDQAARQ